MGPLLLHAEGDGRTGLGHLVRMVAVAGELAAVQPVHLASASPLVNQVVSELAPWATGPFGVHGLSASEESPWGRVDLEGELDSLARHLGARALVSDGRTTYSANAFGSFRRRGRVWLVDNVAASPACFDVLVLPTCHADPAILTRLGPHRVRTGPAWTFVHPAVKALRARARGPREGIFISMGGADPGGLTGRALDHLLETTSDPLVALVGAANGHRAALEAMAMREPRVSLVSGSPATHEALARAEKAVCAFGISAYEAVALGVPLVVVPHDGCVDGDIERFVASFPLAVLAVRTPEQVGSFPSAPALQRATLGELAASLCRDEAASVSA